MADDTTIAIVLIALVAVALHVIHRHETPLHCMAHDLLHAARQRYPDDPRLDRGLSAVTWVGTLEDGLINYQRNTVRRGKFDRHNGHLRIAREGHKGKPLPLSVVHGILVHEVAHACLEDGKHSPEWSRLYAQLLRVATEDLGWDVQLECSTCKFYGVCSAQDCPLCSQKACPKYS